MKYISENEYHSPGNDEHKVIVIFPDKDVIYLECTEDEIGNNEAVADFLRENFVQFTEIQIRGYKNKK